MPQREPDGADPPQRSVQSQSRQPDPSVPKPARRIRRFRDVRPLGGARVAVVAKGDRPRERRQHPMLRLRPPRHGRRRLHGAAT